LVTVKGFNDSLGEPKLWYEDNHRMALKVLSAKTADLVASAMQESSKKRPTRAFGDRECERYQCPQVMAEEAGGKADSDAVGGFHLGIFLPVTGHFHDIRGGVFKALLRGRRL
jgi:hypothetical protein